MRRQMRAAGAAASPAIHAPRSQATAKRSSDADLSPSSDKSAQIAVEDWSIEFDEVAAHDTARRLRTLLSLDDEPVSSAPANRIAEDDGLMEEVADAPPTPPFRDGAAQMTWLAGLLDTLLAADGGHGSTAATVRGDRIQSHAAAADGERDQTGPAVSAPAAAARSEALARAGLPHGPCLASAVQFVQNWKSLSSALQPERHRAEEAARRVLQAAAATSAGSAGSYEVLKELGTGLVAHAPQLASFVRLTLAQCRCVSGYCNAASPAAMDLAAFLREFDADACDMAHWLAATDDRTGRAVDHHALWYRVETLVSIALICQGRSPLTSRWLVARPDAPPRTAGARPSSQPADDADPTTTWKRLVGCTQSPHASAVLKAIVDTLGPFLLSERDPAPTPWPPELVALATIAVWPSLDRAVAEARLVACLRGLVPAGVPPTSGLPLRTRWIAISLLLALAGLWAVSGRVRFALAALGAAEAAYASTVACTTLSDAFALNDGDINRDRAPMLETIAVVCGRRNDAPRALACYARLMSAARRAGRFADLVHLARLAARTQWASLADAEAAVGVLLGVLQSSVAHGGANDETLALLFDIATICGSGWDLGAACEILGRLLKRNQWSRSVHRAAVVTTLAASLVRKRWLHQAVALIDAELATLSASGTERALFWRARARRMLGDFSGAVLSLQRAEGYTATSAASVLGRYAYERAKIYRAAYRDACGTYPMLIHSETFADEPALLRRCCDLFATAAEWYGLAMDRLMMAKAQCARTEMLLGLWYRDLLPVYRPHGTAAASAAHAARPPATVNVQMLSDVAGTALGTAAVVRTLGGPLLLRLRCLMNVADVRRLQSQHGAACEAFVECRDLVLAALSNGCSAIVCRDAPPGYVQRWRSICERLVRFILCEPPDALVAHVPLFDLSVQLDQLAAIAVREAPRGRSWWSDGAIASAIGDAWWHPASGGAGGGRRRADGAGAMVRAGYKWHPWSKQLNNRRLSAPMEVVAKTRSRRLTPALLEFVPQATENRAYATFPLRAEAPRNDARTIVALATPAASSTPSRSASASRSTLSSALGDAHAAMLATLAALEEDTSSPPDTGSTPVGRPTSRDEPTARAAEQKQKPEVGAEEEEELEDEQELAARYTWSLHKHMSSVVRCTAQCALVQGDPHSTCAYYEEYWLHLSSRLRALNPEMDLLLVPLRVPDAPASPRATAHGRSLSTLRLDGRAWRSFADHCTRHRPFEALVYTLVLDSAPSLLCIYRPHTAALHVQRLVGAGERDPVATLHSCSFASPAVRSLLQSVIRFDSRSGDGDGDDARPRVNPDSADSHASRDAATKAAHEAALAYLRSTAFAILMQDAQSPASGATGPSPQRKAHAKRGGVLRSLWGHRRRRSLDTPGQLQSNAAGPLDADVRREADSTAVVRPSRIGVTPLLLVCNRAMHAVAIEQVLAGRPVIRAVTLAVAVRVQESRAHSPAYALSVDSSRHLALPELFLLVGQLTPEQRRAKVALLECEVARASSSLAAATTTTAATANAVVMSATERQAASVGPLCMPVSHSVRPSGWARIGSPILRRHAGQPHLLNGSTVRDPRKLLGEVEDLTLRGSYALVVMSLADVIDGSVAAAALLGHCTVMAVPGSRIDALLRLLARCVAQFRAAREHGQPASSGRPLGVPPTADVDSALQFTLQCARDIQALLCVPVALFNPPGVLPAGAGESTG